MERFIFLFLTIFGLVILVGNMCSADELSLSLVDAMIQVESGGDDYAVGDLDRKHPAYGCLQIRQPAVDDVNRHYGTNYKAVDCLGNRRLSIWICCRYINIYATEERIGRKPTHEDMARIFNGGPNGWKKKSTKKYWEKVQQELDDRRQG